MIEQQLYTRSSNGYFLKAPGYDTVRFSSGLSEEKVQENSFLFNYNGKNVRDIDAMITIITRAVLDDGTVALVGANPYKYMSYDGLKEVFIAHAYYSSGADLDEQVKDVRKIAGVIDFISQHEDGNNSPLPQLPAVPFEDKFSQTDIVRAVNTKIPTDVMCKIVYATMVSAFSDKKVYIVPQDITDVYLILHILKTIYFFLPISLRKRIGYCTMINEQAIPFGVNIAFVPQTIKNEIRNGYVFGSNISNDFCIDLGTQEILNDGEINFDENIPFINLIKLLYDGENIEYAIDVYKNIDSMTGGKDSDLDGYNKIARLYIDYSDKTSDPETIALKLINDYKTVCNICDNNMVFDFINSYIQAYRSKAGDLPDSVLRMLVGIFDLLLEPNKTQVLDDYIIGGIQFCSDNGDNAHFHVRLNIAAENKEVESVVISQFVIVNDSAIEMYFGEKFSLISSLSALCREVSGYEHNTALSNDKLTSNPSFIRSYYLRATELINNGVALEDVKDYLSNGTRFFEPNLNKTTELVVTEYIKKIVGNKAASDFSVKDLRLLVGSFKNNLETDFVKAANALLVYFEDYGSDLYEMLDLLEKETIAVRNYIEAHFENNSPDRETFFAYTAMYFDVNGQRTVDIRSALTRIKDANILVEYIEWLRRYFRYYRHENNLLSATTGEESNEQKYVDLCNAILFALSKIDFDNSSAKANDVVDRILDVIGKSGIPNLEPLEKVFKKNIKKAVSGKGFPLLKLVVEDDDEDDEEDDERESLNHSTSKKTSSNKQSSKKSPSKAPSTKSSSKKNSKKSYNGKQKKNKNKNLYIIIISILVAAIIAAAATGGVLLSKKSKSKDSDSLKTTVSTTVKENTAKEKDENKSKKDKDKGKDKKEDKKEKTTESTKPEILSTEDENASDNNENTADIEENNDNNFDFDGEEN